VDTIEELFSITEILAKQPLPKGPKLTIVTNAGGPGVIATDALIQHGGELAPLSSSIIEACNMFLPAQWSHNNPIDVLGDAGADRYAKAVQVAIENPDSDGVCVVLTPQDMTDPTGTAQLLLPLAKQNKPLLTSWMGGDLVDEGAQILKNASIPTFLYPDTACKAFAMMWRYSYHLQSIYQVPDPMPADDTPELARKRYQAVHALIAQARLERRELLTEEESKRILAAYDIPTVTTLIASSADEAASLACTIGFPVVVKLCSQTITHKSDVGGVKLNLHTEMDVKNAFKEISKSIEDQFLKTDFQGVTVQPMINLVDGYEVILGSSVDQDFGPVILFGSGGKLVEIYKDRSLAIPPLNRTLATRMMEQTKIYRALQGVRGQKPVDLHALEAILVRFSCLVTEWTEIAECDVNPIFLSPERIVALDARIVLHPPGHTYPQTAIRPYPSQYARALVTPQGHSILMRPIRPEDEPLILQFHQHLSEYAVEQRYLKVLHYEERTAHERLRRICFNDYDREIAIVAQEMVDHTIIGVARLTKIHDTALGMFALILQDQWQNLGIGSQLLQHLVEIARQEKLSCVFAHMLPENVRMRHVASKLGFMFEKEGPWIKLSRKL
jgi:acetyltransferase